MFCIWKRDCLWSACTLINMILRGYIFRKTCYQRADEWGVPSTNSSTKWYLTCLFPFQKVAGGVVDCHDEINEYFLIYMLHFCCCSPEKMAILMWRPCEVVMRKCQEPARKRACNKRRFDWAYMWHILYEIYLGWTNVGKIQISWNCVVSKHDRSR